MKPRARTLPPRAALSGRLLARFAVRNWGVRATVDSAYINHDVAAAAGWVRSLAGPGLERGRHVLLPGVDGGDWQLLSTSPVLPSFADARTHLSDVAPTSAIKSVHIAPLALRAPLRLAPGEWLPGDRARTRCEYRELAVVSGREITLQISSSTGKNGAGVFADAFTFPMSKNDGAERRAVYPLDARNIQPHSAPGVAARAFAEVLDRACEFVGSVPEVQLDTSLKLGQRTFGDVYITGAGERVFVLGLPARVGLTRFRVDLAAGRVDRFDNAAGWVPT